MYKILIVEDESLIRDSIRNVIENMPGPYVLCGEAEDGEIALSIMQDTMPNILITDLRMPFLDGFGLIAQARAMMPWLKIIVLSGYGDFQSAQRLIAMGVDKYLLKPVRSAEIASAVQEMVTKLENEKKLHELPFGFAKDEIWQAMFQNYMKDLLLGTVPPPQLLDKANALGLNVVAPCYELVLFHFEIADGETERLHSRCMNLTGRMDVPLHYFHVFDGLVLLLTGSEREQLKEEAYKLNMILRHELEDLSPLVTTVISRIFTRFSMVPDLFRATESFMQKMLHAAVGRVVDMDDAVMTGEAVRSALSGGDEFWQNLFSASSAELEQRVDEYMNSPAGSACGSMMYRYSTLVSIARMVTEVCRSDESLRGREERLLQEHDILAASEHRGTFRDTVISLYRDLALLRDEPVGSISPTPVIISAEKYMRENYCDPNISLVSVARSVNMSPSHFSTVFSQACGKSFITLLTELRMEKAKELLAGSDLRVTDVAMQIGYNEPNYFSHVFKKETGLSPKEYRLRKQNV